MKIGIVQFCAGEDKAENLRQLATAVRELSDEGCDFTMLPEMSMYLAADPAKMRDAAEDAHSGPYVTEMAALARETGMFLHAGSMMERDADQFFNTTVVLDPRGRRLAAYRKIHRFDVRLPDGTEFRESRMVDRGESVVTVDVGDVRVGLTICYDLRFPELFRALVDRGASLIVVPAAFTFQTGADHWEVLLRARAIETQCYVAAPAQVGTFGGGKYMNFGHGMIIDPWGNVVAQVSNRPGTASTILRADYVDVVRSRIPVQSHRVL